MKQYDPVDWGEGDFGAVQEKETGKQTFKEDREMDVGTNQVQVKVRVRIETRPIMAWAMVVESDSASSGEPTGTLYPITYQMDARRQGEAAGHFIKMGDPTAPAFDLFNLRTVIPATACMQVLLVATDDKGKDIYVSDGKTPAGTVRVQRIIGLDTAGYHNEAEWERCRKDAEEEPGRYFWELSEEGIRDRKRAVRRIQLEREAWKRSYREVPVIATEAEHEDS